MVIELRNLGFTNKGAELMLLAILERIRKNYPKSRFVMSPTPTSGSRPYLRIATEGIFLKASLSRYGIQWGDLAMLVPAKLRDSYGLVLDSEIDLVLDCSGFAYSETLGKNPLRELDAATNRWFSRGTKIVLLPQAMGPFQTKASRKILKRIAPRCTAIFTRDETSYQALRNAVHEVENISVYPDFTALVKGVCPRYFSSEHFRVAVIPNSRMLRDTELAVASQYENFLLSCLTLLKSKNEAPFLLVHDNNDVGLASRLAENAGVNMLIEHNPIALKGILGQCYATIGGRYHGLVSALSQGVPSLATTWSHKYIELLADYGFEEGLLLVNDEESALSQKLSLILDPDSNNSLRGHLLQRAGEICHRAEQMWDRVYEIIQA